MIILDTCALLWWAFEPEKLSKRAKKRIEELQSVEGSIGIPSICFWEIAVKVRNKKLDLKISPTEFHTRMKKVTAVTEINSSGQDWVDAVALDWSHADHVDRLIVAQAKKHKAQLITSDKSILAFYKQGYW